MIMIKMIRYALIISSGTLFAATSHECELVKKEMTSVIHEGYKINLSPDESEVIEELITTIATSSTFRLALKVNHLKSISKKIQTVSSSHFLGFIFERKDLVCHMKEIKKSPSRWKGLTKSIVLGLKKEMDAGTLSKDIPMFAAYTRANAHVLNTLAKNQDYNGFIVHLLEQN
jgi:hypothetical protein